MTPLVPDYEVLGVPMEKIARLARTVAARANNEWKVEKVHPRRSTPLRMRERYRCQAKIVGKSIHLVEHGPIMSIRCDGWALNFEGTGWQPGNNRAFVFPSAAGVTLVEGAKTYPAKYSGYEISSAGKFKHDMSILLMFESEW